MYLTPLLPLNQPLQQLLLVFFGAYKCWLLQQHPALCSKYFRAG
jgi:hypothetical protein